MVATAATRFCVDVEVSRVSGRCIVWCTWIGGVTITTFDVILVVAFDVVAKTTFDVVLATTFGVVDDATTWVLVATVDVAVEVATRFSVFDPPLVTEGRLNECKSDIQSLPEAATIA